MAQQRTAQAVTIAVIALIVAIVAIRQSGWRPSRPAAREQTPQDAIYAMLDAAREGDVETYIGHYAGQIRATLEQAIEEQGEDGFARYLRESNAPIKGIAITEPEKIAPDQVKARVEYVYADRNEVQYMYLTRRDGRWVITRVDAVQRIETVIPYGTPVE